MLENGLLEVWTEFSYLSPRVLGNWFPALQPAARLLVGLMDPQIQRG